MVMTMCTDGCLVGGWSGGERAGLDIWEAVDAMRVVDYGVHLL